MQYIQGDIGLYGGVERAIHTFVAQCLKKGLKDGFADCNYEGFLIKQLEDRLSLKICLNAIVFDKNESGDEDLSVFVSYAHKLAAIPVTYHLLDPTRGEEIVYRTLLGVKIPENKKEIELYINNEIVEKLREERWN
jgi:hypothetical protein